MENYEEKGEMNEKKRIKKGCGGKTGRQEALGFSELEKLAQHID